MLTEKEKISLYEKISSLEETKSTFNFLLENTTDYIYFKDRNGHFTFASNSFAALTNHNSWKDIVGKNDFDIFPKEHAELYTEGDKCVLLDGKELLSIEEPYSDDKGIIGWVSTSKRPIFNDKHEIVGLFGISRDITKIKELEAELNEQAHYDRLTGLSNRAFFLEQSTLFLNVLKRNQGTIALFFIDLDGFKIINDKYGHKAGDFILQSVSKNLKNHFRKTDIVGRLGGDEFTVLAFFDNEESLNQISKKIIKTINQPIQFENSNLQVGCSIGIASFPTHGDTIEELIFKADKAMYVAKGSGKNTCVFFKEKSV